MKAERGAILLIVLIVLLTISLLGATLVALFYNVFSTSQTELDRARALYLAEAGVASAIGVLKGQGAAGQKPEEKPAPARQSPSQKQSKNLSNTTQQQIVPPTELGEGSFEVYCDSVQSTIISIGECNGVKRTVQVKYNAF